MCLEEEDHLVTARSGGVDAACCCGHSIKVPQHTQEEHPRAHHVHGSIQDKFRQYSNQPLQPVGMTTRYIYVYMYTPRQTLKDQYFIGEKKGEGRTVQTIPL